MTNTLLLTLMAFPRAVLPARVRQVPSNVSEEVTVQFPIQMQKINT